MKAASILLIVFLLLFTTCQKEKLPKPTREGKNTFGCKINGKNWVPHGGGGLLNPIEPLHGGFYGNAHTIFIRAYNNEESIELYLKDVYKQGMYTLNSNTLQIPDNLDPNNYGLYSIEKDSMISFITSTAYTGSIYITKRDTINKIVSGTFEFTAKNKNTGKIVKITDGRFDITTRL